MTTATPSHPRFAALQNEFAAAHEEMLAAIAAVPEARRNERPAEGSWSVAEVLEHLAMANRTLAAAMRRTLEEARAAGPLPHDAQTSLAETVLPSGAAFDGVQRYTAPERFLPSNAAQFADAASRQSASRSELLAILADYDGTDFTQFTAPHPRLGVLHYYHWFHFVALHERHHAAQVRRIAEAFRGA